MAKWITGYQDEIVCREVHGSRQESFNAVTGNPIFKVRLEVRYVDLKKAISRLLGGPAVWPHSTTYFTTVVAVAAELVSDQGSYNTDTHGQIINYDNNVFIDVTYSARLGRYIQKRNLQSQENAIDVFYWEDRIEPRYDTIPLNHNLLHWGEKVGQPVPTTAGRTLAPDETPTTPIPGQTLIHIIEGWYYKQDFTPFIGTTNDKDYTSPINGQVYKAETLLLRSINVDYTYSFNSFKEAALFDPAFYVPTGKPTLTLRMIYEYKPIEQGGWEAYWRNNLDASIDGPTDPKMDSGYYYIRQNKKENGKWPRLKPFAAANHDRFLKYDFILF